MTAGGAVFEQPKMQARFHLNRKVWGVYGRRMRLRRAHDHTFI